MMDTIKITLLCAVVLFSGYSQYTARQYVKTSEKCDKKLLPVKSRVDDEDIGFMKRAIDLSFVSIEKNQGAPFGSIVVRDGNIIGEGSDKTHLMRNRSAHPEVEAIRDAYKKTSSEKLHGSVMYASSQPCILCKSLISLAGIEKIYYCIPRTMMTDFTDSDHVYKMQDASQATTSVPEFQIMPQDAKGLVKSYVSLIKDASAL